MTDVVKQIDVYLVKLGENEYVNPALTLFLILYASLIAPKLSERFARLFDVPLFNLLLFFLIAYTARLNPAVAIIAAIGVLVSMMTLNNYKVNKKMLAVVAAQDVASKVVQASAPEAFEGMDVASEAPVVRDSEMEMPVLSENDIPVAALTELQADTCVKRADYRNSFYPQYVNMDPSAYLARYSDGSVAGYDTHDISASYASI